MAEYIPKKGDIVSLFIDGQVGHEQKGRRPALIVSNTLFNKHTGLAYACPITNTDRAYPFHAPLPSKLKTTGVVMSDQLKTIDYTARKIKYIEKAPTETLNEVLDLIDSIIN